MTEPKAPEVIVLLEDDDLDAELIIERLAEERIGLEVRRATDEQSYLSCLDRGDVALILSDFALPSYDGQAALEVAGQRAPSAPFLFVSGAIGEELAIHTMRQGATDYVFKHRLDRLGPAVRRALAEAETQRRRQQAERERDRLLASEREARRAAEAASRLKDEFLAVASHELRTPLQAILGWATLLTSSSPAPATLERGLSTILRNARVQCRLIEDILDLSRITTGKLHLHLASVNAEAFISAAIEAVRPEAEAKNLSIEMAIEGDVGDIHADGERLQQVVANLVSNAVKFTEPGGAVRVTAKREEERLTIGVTDTGRGIDQELLPYIFEPFRQGDASKAREHRGLGLGLAIVRHLAEMHGGTVAVASEGPGHGATFTVAVPMRAKMPAPSARAVSEAWATASEEDPAALAGVRVLIVDDEPDARILASEVLCLSGAEVATAGCVADALETFASFRPDVLVSDIGMPHADGHTLIRAVRRLPPHLGGNVPAVALTAYAAEIDRQATARAGYQKHLTKPVPPHVLVQAVAELLDRVTPT